MGYPLNEEVAPIVHGTTHCVANCRHNVNLKLKHSVVSSSVTEQSLRDYLSKMVEGGTECISNGSHPCPPNSIRICREATKLALEIIEAGISNGSHPCPPLLSLNTV